MDFFKSFKAKTEQLEKARDERTKDMKQYFEYVLNEKVKAQSNKHKIIFDSPETRRKKLGNSCRNVSESGDERNSSMQDDTLNSTLKNTEKPIRNDQSDNQDSTLNASASDMFEAACNLPTIDIQENNIDNKLTQNSAQIYSKENENIEPCFSENIATQKTIILNDKTFTILDPVATSSKHEQEVPLEVMHDCKLDNELKIYEENVIETHQHENEPSGETVRKEDSEGEARERTSARVEEVDTTKPKGVTRNGTPIVKYGRIRPTSSGIKGVTKKTLPLKQKMISHAYGKQIISSAEKVAIKKAEVAKAQQSRTLDRFYSTL